MTTCLLLFWNKSLIFSCCLNVRRKPKTWITSVYGGALLELVAQPGISALLEPWTVSSERGRGHSEDAQCKAAHARRHQERDQQPWPCSPMDMGMETPFQLSLQTELLRPREMLFLQVWEHRYSGSLVELHLTDSSTWRKLDMDNLKRPSLAKKERAKDAGVSLNTERIITYKYLASFCTKVKCELFKVLCGGVRKSWQASSGN